MQSIFVKDIINYSDLLYWLHGEYNKAKNYLEAFKTILIPIYVAFLSIFNILMEDKIGWPGFLVVVTFIVYVSTKELLNASLKVDFFEDIILLIENNK